MKYFIFLYLLPMSLFWSWFGLSYYDMNFGFSFLSRDVHDIIFGIYSQILGLSYESLISGFINAYIFDSLLIGAIIAYRKRRQIKAWWQERKANQAAAGASAQDIQCAPRAPIR